MANVEQRPAQNSETDAHIRVDVTVGRRSRPKKFRVHHIPVERLLYDKRGNVYGLKLCKCGYK
jgi:hypothetical protein